MRRQFDIHWVALDPTRGVETKKTRPCLILQSDLLNQSSRSVIVAPFLPGHKDWPFVINVRPSDMNGLDNDRHVNIKQSCAVDVSRLHNSLGTLEGIYHSQIRDVLRLVFGL